MQRIYLLIKLSLRFIIDLLKLRLDPRRNIGSVLHKGVEAQSKEAQHEAKMLYKPVMPIIYRQSFRTFILYLLPKCNLKKEGCRIVLTSVLLPLCFPMEPDRNNFGLWEEESNGSASSRFPTLSLDALLTRGSYVLVLRLISVETIGS